MKACSPPMERRCTSDRVESEGKSGGQGVCQRRYFCKLNQAFNVGKIATLYVCPYLQKCNISEMRQHPSRVSRRLYVDAAMKLHGP